jgi:putative Mn2+ efflux pump MntP
VTPWTEIASVVALGFGANTENLPVGLAYGLRRRRIGLGRNLFIAGATTAATLVPLAIGQGLHGYIPAGASDAIAGLLLAGLGLFNVWAERRGPRKRVDAAAAAEGTAAPIGLRETLALAGALSINNIGLGFAGGVAGLGQAPVGLSVAGFSVVLLWLGEWLSRRIASGLANTSRWLQLDGNFLLVAVGGLMILGL